MQIACGRKSKKIKHIKNKSTEKKKERNEIPLKLNLPKIKELKSCKRLRTSSYQDQSNLDEEIYQRKQPCKNGNELKHGK